MPPTAPSLDLDAVDGAIEAAAPPGGDGGAGAQNADFDDLLHAFTLMPRPSNETEVSAVASAIYQLVEAAGDDAKLWKALALAIVLRRYHSKAPEAVAAAAAAASGDAAAAAAASDEGGGHGERLIFYLAIRTLIRAALSGAPNASNASSAAAALVRLAPLAGGTRDVCSLLEHLGSEALSRSRASGALHVSAGDDAGTLRRLIEAVRLCLADAGGPQQSTFLAESGHGALLALIEMAAGMLDADLKIVRQRSAEAEKAASAKSQGKQKADADAMEEDKDKDEGEGAAAASSGGGASSSSSSAHIELMSTISTFLPHNNRGASGSHRRLVQSLAELLIWSRTEAASNNTNFAEAIAQLLALPDALGEGGSATEAEALIHRLQAAIRRLRKELAASAREQGFALCAQYDLDAGSLTLSQIKRGKAGDLNRLKQIASKRGDVRLLKLLERRSSDAKKAVPFESVGAMVRGWVALDPREAGMELDELQRLDRSLQRAAVQATVERLRRRVPALSADAAEHAVTIACLDGGVVNQAAAVLVAAAMHPQGWGGEPTDAEVAIAAAEVQAAIEGGGAITADAAIGTGKKDDDEGGSSAASAAAAGSSAASAAAAASSAASAASSSAPPAKRSRLLDGASSSGGGGGDGGGGGGGGGGPSSDEPPPKPPPKLLLGEIEVDVSTAAKAMAWLDAIVRRAVPEMADENGPIAAAAAATAGEALGVPASTKAVQNLIDRHVSPGDLMVLFTAADIRLEERVLSRLQAEGSTIHAHINDEMMARMEREGARVGDVTISLSWNSWDDLDLHVITPSGAEIYYGNRSSDGGTLDVDMNAGGANSIEPVENCFFGDADRGIEAMRGKYKVIVQNYTYHSRGEGIAEYMARTDFGAVPFTVIVRKNGYSTTYTGETAAGKTGSQSNVTVCEFVYEGRTAVRPSEAVPSLGESASLVAVTASAGSTLDALGGLMGLQRELAQLEEARSLIQEEGDLDAPVAGSNTAPMRVVEDEDLPGSAMDMFYPEADDDEPSLDDLLAAPPGPPAVVGEHVTVAASGAEVPQGRQPVRASRGRFEVTSRDRLYLLLSKLPQRFHSEVAGAFGGQTLLELSAAELAERLIESGVDVRELRANGYPDVIVELVKRHMMKR